MSDVHFAPLPAAPRFYRGARLGLLALVATPFLAVAGWEWQFLVGMLAAFGSGRIDASWQLPGLALACLAAGGAVTATVLALVDRRSATPVLRVVVAALAGASALLLVVTTALQIASVAHLATMATTDVPH